LTAINGEHKSSKLRSAVHIAANQRWRPSHRVAGRDKDFGESLPEFNKKFERFA
jgi:hypothetical protein